MEQTKIYTALKGVRGREAVNLAALEQLLVRFSQLSVEQRQIAEIDINPLLASPNRLVALDARVVLHDKNTSEEPLPELAIRPYPIQYVSRWKAKNGSEITIRPIRPEDEGLMVKFHESLSERSVYYRYLSAFQLSKRVAHERLIRMCFIDYDREMALVADHKDPLTGEHQILGVGRLIKLHATNDAELGLLVTDKWQGRRGRHGAVATGSGRRAARENQSHHRRVSTRKPRDTARVPARRLPTATRRGRQPPQRRHRSNRNRTRDTLTSHVCH